MRKIIHHVFFFYSLTCSSVVEHTLKVVTISGIGVTEENEVLIHETLNEVIILAHEKPLAERRGVFSLEGTDLDSYT